MRQPSLPNRPVCSPFWQSAAPIHPTPFRGMEAASIISAGCTGETCMMAQRHLTTARHGLCRNPLRFLAQQLGPPAVDQQQPRRLHVFQQRDPIELLLASPANPPTSPALISNHRRSSRLWRSRSPSDQSPSSLGARAPHIHNRSSLTTRTRKELLRSALPPPLLRDRTGHKTSCNNPAHTAGLLNAINLPRRMASQIDFWTCPRDNLSATVVDIPWNGEQWLEVFHCHAGCPPAAPLRADRTFRPNWSASRLNWKAQT